MSKRITTEQLHTEIQVIKDNHLKHLHDCVHRLEGEIKDNRTFFTGRLDRLDNRIWWIMGLVVTTLITVVVELLSH